MKRNVNRRTFDNARQLRGNLTPAEKILWSKLRANQLLGLHVRKQCPIGPYIVDFVIPKCKLIVELDGESHDYQLEYDGKRDQYLENSGFKILRILNQDIYKNMDGVWDLISDECMKRIQ